MRKARKNTATRQVVHIVGEGLTELFSLQKAYKFGKFGAVPNL